MAPAGEKSLVELFEQQAERARSPFRKHSKRLTHPVSLFSF
jgi:hypothetical protein